jgi:hypothetical protein
MCGLKLSEHDMLPAKTQTNAHTHIHLFNDYTYLYDVPGLCWMSY